MERTSLFHCPLVFTTSIQPQSKKTFSRCTHYVSLKRPLLKPEINCDFSHWKHPFIDFNFLSNQQEIPFLFYFILFSSDTLNGYRRKRLRSGREMQTQAKLVGGVVRFTHWMMEWNRMTPTQWKTFFYLIGRIN